MKKVWTFKSISSIVLAGAFFTTGDYFAFKYVLPNPHILPFGGYFLQNIVQNITLGALIYTIILLSARKKE